MENSSNCVYLLEIFPGMYLAYCFVPISIALYLLGSLTLIIIWRTQLLHTNVFMFIASMAVTNIMLGVAVMLEGLHNMPGLKLYLPDRVSADNFVLGICYGMTFLSVAHMGTLALDRYLHIALPFYYMIHATKNRVWLVILVTWFSACIFVFLPLLVYKADKYHVRCILLYAPTEYFLTWLALYCLSFMTVCVSYYKIARLAFKHKKARNTRHKDADTLAENNRLAAFKSVKFFLLIFGTFSTCTFPLAISTLINGYYDLPSFVYMTFVVMFMIHPIMNFFITLRMNQSFAQGLKKLVHDLHGSFCKMST